MLLHDFDNRFYESGYACICGVDEAGRGPLAGPVYAAAVILPQGKIIPGLDDSKKLTEKKRDALYGIIIRDALAYNIAQATAAEIDSLNILAASMLAMRRAISGLGIKPDLALVDGNTDPKPGIPAATVVGGDAKSACIAAASVLAKVARDRCLAELDRIYPQYAFAKHKGYATKLHYEMLDTHGPCEEHRETFLVKWRAAKGV
ncbi:MAG: ribonuclease HII [Oscillospiraceae bacterium]|nr:ribonuclease HII [Oscillospiraceae bacterium]